MSDDMEPVPADEAIEAWRPVEVDEQYYRDSQEDDWPQLVAAGRDHRTGQQVMAVYELAYVRREPLDEDEGDA